MLRTDMDTKLRRALELRYDGPIPDGASVPPDYDRTWLEQLENRKRWSWLEVRRLGRLAARAHMDFCATGELRHRREWARLRRNLVFALRIWSAYRAGLRGHAEHAAGDHGKGR